MQRTYNKEASQKRYALTWLALFTAVIVVGCDTGKKQPFAIRQNPGVFGAQADPFGATRNTTTNSQAAALPGLQDQSRLLGGSNIYQQGVNTLYTEQGPRSIEDKIPGATQWWPFVTLDELRKEEAKYFAADDEDFDGDGITNSIEVQGINDGGTDTNPLIFNGAMVAAMELAENDLHNALALDVSEEYEDGYPVLTSVRNMFSSNRDAWIKMNYRQSVPDNLKPIFRAAGWEDNVSLIRGGISQQVGFAGLPSGSIIKKRLADERRSKWGKQGGFLMVTQFWFYTHKPRNVAFTFFKRPGRHKENNGTFGGGSMLLKDGVPIVNTFKAEEILPNIGDLAYVGPLLSVGGIVDSVLEGVAQGVWGVMQGIGFDDDEVMLRTMDEPVHFQPGINNGSAMVLIQYVTDIDEVEELLVDMDYPPGHGKGDGYGYHPIKRENMQWFHDGWYYPATDADDARGGEYRFPNDDENPLVYWMNQNAVNQYRSGVLSHVVTDSAREPQVDEDDCSCGGGHCSGGNCSGSGCGNCSGDHGESEPSAWMTFEEIGELLRRLKDLRDVIEDDDITASMRAANESCRNGGKILDIEMIHARVYNPASNQGILEEAIRHVEEMYDLARALGIQFRDPNTDDASQSSKAALRAEIVNDINIFYSRYYEPLKSVLNQIDQNFNDPSREHIRKAAYNALDAADIPGFRVTTISLTSEQTGGDITGRSVDEWLIEFNTRTVRQKINNIWQFAELIEELATGNYICKYD